MSTKNLFQLLANALNNSSYLFWIYDERDRLVFANSVFFSATGLKEDSLNKELDLICKDQDMCQLIRKRLTETRKSKNIYSANETIYKGSTPFFYESSWFNIDNECGRFVAGYAVDVTNRKKQNQEIKKLATRLSYFSLNTKDTIWEWDPVRKHLHFNGQLKSLSGFHHEVKNGTMHFWLNKVINPKDKIPLLKKISAGLKKGQEFIEIEYRITTKSGQAKLLSDQLCIQYANKKPVKIYGLMKDKTEMLKLETEIRRHEQEKEIAVNQALVKAQEEERDRISKELHDNVNQLILSSKMYISIARNQPQHADEMLEKAVEYQLMALEESRKFARGISSTFLENKGFRKILDELINQFELNGIRALFAIEPELIEMLTPYQVMMLARIIQEQSSNILKYAFANTVTLRLQSLHNKMIFSIADDGQGFDAAAVKGGVGLSNIKSRVLALGGSLDMITAPGKGCTIAICFNKVAGENSIKQTHAA